MLTFIFISFAAVCKALADTVYFHYYTSVFSDKGQFDEYFWNPDKSWIYAKRIRGYKIDAWHLSNSGMIVFFVLAAMAHDIDWQWWIQLPVLGTQFILMFNMCFNKLFKLPTK